MSSSNKVRQVIFDKYGGRCAYCGCDLQKGWHVDEIEPVRRNKIWNREKSRWEMDKENPYTHPERMCIENQNPACASCNINKHSMTLEEFREAILKFVQSLNLYNTQYKIAKRYGLVKEHNAEVVFYFESLNPQP